MVKDILSNNLSENQLEHLKLVQLEKKMQTDNFKGVNIPYEKAKLITRMTEYENQIRKHENQHGFRQTVQNDPIFKQIRLRFNRIKKVIDFFNQKE